MAETTTPPAPDAAEVRKHFKYIPALDGMRGFWVVFGPLLYHARPESVPGGPDILPGGILGVDMFFVLSSFLITGIALNEIDGTGTIDLKAYAGRRVRRLFPALFALIIFLAFYLALSDPELVPRWTGAMVSALAYVANWYEIGSGVDYFDQWQNPSPLKHVWSFSIEEQFYLFAPLFIIACHKWFPKRARTALLISSVAGALLSAWWMSRVHVQGAGDPSRAYYGTDTRAQAFFVGISMAVLVRMWGPVRRALNSQLVAVLAYPATIWFFWAVTNVSERDDWMFEQGGFLLAAVMSAIILHGLRQPAPWSPLHRIFESRPFIYVGRISYGLYLYHWPVYLLVTGERVGDWFGIDPPSGYGLLTIHLAITFAVAITSFHLIEQPFTARKFPWTGAKLDLRNGALAGSLAIIVILAGLLWANSDRPDDIEQVIIEVPAAAAEPAVDFGETEIAGVQDSATTGEVNELAAAGGAAGPTRVLVIGDSVSAQIGWALHEWGEQNPGRIVVFNESHLGCGVVRHGDKRVNETDAGPVGDVCSNWDVPVAPHTVADSEVVSWPTAIELFQPDVVLGHISSWDVADRIVPGVADDWTSVGDPAYDAYVHDEYVAATEVLTAQGADLYWLRSPYLNRDLLPEDHQERVDGINEIVAQAAEAIPDRAVTLVDYPGWIGPVGGDRDVELRDDGVHLTELGFEEIGPWLVGELGLA